MDTSLLNTKLYIPPIPPEIVSRSRLIEHLTAGLHRKLTLISAPAGFGKTTLLSEWIHEESGWTTMTRPKFAWLSLDRDDNDPIRFWSYIIGAIQTIQTDVGKSCLKILQSPNPVVAESFLTILINDIDDRLEDFVLVLDDYHLIETKTIHQAMVFFIDHVPPQLHLVIAGRTDPPLLLARLRGSGQLDELRTTDLRFTSEETATFLNQVMALHLTDENITTLENRTEGWIASLQMAGASMQGRDDISNFIKGFSGTHHYIMDYLTEEVLQRQEQHIQSFLLKTSILECLSGSLANVVTGGNDGQERLEQLASANLFLVPLDDDRKWFRYHQLFADLLRNQLIKTEPHLLPGLHQRASEWFEQEGLVAEAVNHALIIEDYERAADLIESIAVPLIRVIRLSEARFWLVKMPFELIETRPWLCVILAKVHLAAGEYDTGERFLNKAESLISGKEGIKFFKSAEDYNRIRNHMTALKATLTTTYGDISSAIELCHETLKHLPDDQLTTRCMLTWNLGAAYFIRGEVSIASRHLEEAFKLSQPTGNNFIALICLGYQADIQVTLGHLHKAAELDRRAIELGVQWGGGNPLAATSYAYISMAQILYQWNRIDEAMSHLKQGIELSKGGAEAIVATMAFPGVALLSELHDTEGIASQTLEQVKRIASASHIARNSNIVNAWMARLLIARGDLPSAQQWIESHRSSDLNLHALPDTSSEFEYLTLVRVNIARGDVDELPELLEQLCQLAEAEGRIGSEIEILTLQSIALYLNGKIDEALEAFRRALSLAEPEGYLRIFVDEGNPVKELLQLAASRGIAIDYVDRILNAFEPSTSAPGSDRRQTKVRTTRLPTSKPLSARELEVLQLLAAGATSKEIANELFLSVRTVKKHTENIYSKLDVHKRTLAVDRACRLGLL